MLQCNMKVEVACWDVQIIMYIWVMGLQTDSEGAGYGGVWGSGIGDRGSGIGDRGSDPVNTVCIEISCFLIGFHV